MTPFHCAARSGRSPQVLQALLDAGAKIDECDEYGSTALMDAASEGKNPETVGFLLSKGADGRLKTKRGATAFDAADENDAIVNSPAYFGLRRAQLDPAGFHALCCGGKAGELADALKKGAKVNEPDSSGFTPLMWAAAGNTPDAVSILVKAGASLKTKDKKGETCLSAAARFNRDPDVVRTLVSLGEPVDELDTGMNTPLMVSVMSNPNPDVAAALIALGANVDARNERGKTALICAALYGADPAMIRLLVDSGADCAAQDNDGWHALDYVKSSSRLKKTSAVCDIADALRKKEDGSSSEDEAGE